MPFSLPTSVGTAQDFIPIVDLAQIGKLGGAAKHFPTIAALNTAVTKELANAAGVGALWSMGEPITTGSDAPGVIRYWNNTHARTVVIGGSVLAVLAASANVVLAAVGTPAGGTGADGDLAVDIAGASVYTKASGVWTKTASLGGNGIVTAVRGETVCSLGDSHARLGITLASAPRFENVGALNWGLAFLGQDLWLPFGCSASYTSGPADIINYCLAVSGETTIHVRDVQVPQAVLLGAGRWSVQAGLNDLLGIPADSAQTIINRFIEICQAGLHVGASVDLWTIPPNNHSQWTAFEAAIISAGSTIAAQRKKQMEINSWMRRYAQETAGIHLIDDWNELVDPASATGDWRAGLSDDGTHRNGAGAFISGQVYARAIRPFVKVSRQSNISSLDAFDATNHPSGNLAVRFGMQGGDGTTPPTGWTVNMQANTATLLTATQARTDTLAPGIPANGRELQITASAMSAASIARAYQDAMPVGIPANTPFYAEVEISVSANSAAWSGPTLLAFFSDGTPAAFPMGMNNDGSALPVGSTFDAVIRTPLCRSTAASAGLLFTQLHGLAGGAVTMKIRNVSIRALDSTAPGGLLLGAGS